MWNEDEDSGVIRVRMDEEYALKRDKEREVPLLSELRAILLPIAKPAGYIIENPRERSSSGDHYLKAFYGHLATCGIEKGERTPHSTRHTWISLMLATDVNSIQVKEWAGHDALVTTEGYSKAQSSYRQSVKRWPKGDFRLREVTHDRIHLPTTGSKSSVG